MENNFRIKVFDEIPENIVGQVDRLLESNGSNNRISEDAPRANESRERFINKKDRIKYILTFDKDQVVGIIIIFKREIKFKGEKLIVGGIGAVGTKKEYRGKGIATKMLRIAREELEKATCDIATLGTDITDPVMVKMYGKIGFVPLGRNHVYLGMSGKSYTSNDLMIAPIKSKEKFQEVLTDKSPFNLGQGLW